MATMIDGESYLGQVLVRPISESGDVTIYLWPVRCLKMKLGGPTFGVDVNGDRADGRPAAGPGKVGVFFPHPDFGSFPGLATK